MRSKETEELVHSSWSIDHHFLLTLHWLGNRIKYLMWSQITFLLSIRRTGSRQIDFKVLSLWMLKIFYKLNFRKSIAVEICKVNKYFPKVNKHSSKFRQIFFQWLWSQINVRSSIRLTVSRQIDFKELDKYLKAKPELY